MKNRKIMKKNFVLGVVMGIAFFAVANIASAHGWHEEVREGIEHLTIHIVQNGATVLGTLLALLLGYGVYRFFFTEEE